MKRIAFALLAFTVAACSDQSLTPLAPAPSAAIVDGDVIVTNSNDAGPGSFRDAIAQANANAAIGTIGFGPRVSTIAIQGSITFVGSQDLTINANRATIDASAAGASGFVATGGGDLEIIGLTVRNAAGQGIEVQVPAAATGTIRVALMNVDILGNTGHGFMVDDQLNNSSASVDVSVVDSRFIGNGYSVSDRDGIRVNEGGVGSITFTSVNSRMEDNAADGIELDEMGIGDVTIDVRRTQILRNGIFDPSDLDDGFDIDEAGDGSILGQVVSSVASHNYEEGLDFNENDNGDLRVDLSDVNASFNREEGIDYEEDDDSGTQGDLVATMDRVTMHGNGVDGGDGGLKIREKSGGNLNLVLTDIIATGNSLAGIHVNESGAGSSTVSIAKAVANANVGDGMEVLGTTTLSTFIDITVSGNGSLGLSVAQGTANVTNVKGGGNVAGLTGGGATFVTVP